MAYRSLAEEIVRHLPVTPFSLAYADGKTTPVYVLPTDVPSEGVVRGLFPINGNFGASRFSLEVCEDSGTKRFRLDNTMPSLVEIVGGELGIPSLPLERTEFKVNLREFKASAEYLPDLDSPFSMYGFPSDQGTLPIIFAIPKMDTYQFFGIFVKNQKMGLYSE